MKNLIAGVGVAALLAGCTTPPEPNSLDWDPHRNFNMAAHQVNVSVDRVAYGPVARAYGDTVPPMVRRGITNVRDNWRLPSHVVQFALQGQGLEVAKSTTRFLVNTTFGLGGVLDVAKDMNLPYEDTGFNETLFKWGVPEGGYLEMPLGGPGTERDWAAWGLDIVADPVSLVLPQDALNGLLVVGGLDTVNQRYEMDSVVEALMHQSANSYDATRIAYLQSMRAALAGGTSVDTLEDVYASE
ncbi:MAG: VacJ family lipoprotein [Amaricoccus sp.]|uniref:MlaA family lipoprotein n=1 Tax=Amaricoccus sp. TaxID=1872485 RepID=UPI0039E568A4